MGKGVGKLANWAGFLKAGAFLFEVKNLRWGRATYFLRQTAFKLPVHTSIVQARVKTLRLLMTRRSHFFNTHFN